MKKMFTTFEHAKDSTIILKTAIKYLEQKFWQISHISMIDYPQ